MHAVDEDLRIPHPWRLALLAVIAIVAWWPLRSYWQSDDFLAVNYADNFAQALSDFAGGHYGLQSLVVFYRPMITLSFALEQNLGGFAQPFLSHFTNILAHAVTAICLARIARRFMPERQAWITGLLWALAPSHAGSICWAVGRVDSHTTMWIALATLCVIRRCEARRHSLALGLWCFALALGSKELALVVPGIAAVFGFAMAPGGRRITGLIGATWPYLVGLLLYFGWRMILFGTFLSGYETNVQPIKATIGLGVWATRLLNPLTHSGSGIYAESGFAMPAFIPWLGFVPLTLAVAAAAKPERRPFLLAVVCLFLGCSTPMIATWADTGNLMNLRGFYLPMMPLAALIATGGWRSALPALLVWALPFAELRRDYLRSWDRCAAVHTSIRNRATDDLNFIAGLPRANDRSTSIEFHLGLDRLLRPPFVAGGRRTVYALRPMSQDPRANRIPYGPAQRLPFGLTLAATHEDVATVLDAPNHGALTINRIGPETISLAVLDQMVRNHQARQAGLPTVGTDPAFLVKGVRAKRYRVTIFTASGYLTTMVPDTAPPGTDGRIEIGLILYGTLDKAGHQRVGDLLQHGTALDLSCRFPLLVEADLRPQAVGFQPTHMNQQPIFLGIDRLFANWWP